MLTSLQKAFENGMIASLCFNVPKPTWTLSLFGSRFVAVLTSSIAFCVESQPQGHYVTHATWHVTSHVSPPIPEISRKLTQTIQALAQLLCMTLVTSRRKNRHDVTAIDRSAQILFLWVFGLFCWNLATWCIVCWTGIMQIRVTEVVKNTNFLWVDAYHKHCMEALFWSLSVQYFQSRFSYSIQEPRSSWAPSIQHCT